MPCETIFQNGKAIGIACTRGRRRRRCSECSNLVDQVWLCGWKLAGKKKGKTCDRPVCASCRTNVGSDKDLCGPHARLWGKHPLNPKNKEAVST